MTHLKRWALHVVIKQKVFLHLYHIAPATAGKCTVDNAVTYRVWFHVKAVAEAEWIPFYMKQKEKIILGRGSVNDIIRAD